MLGLFGDYAFKEKKETVSCLGMAKSMFSDDVKLIKELSNYLHNRKSQRNMPRKKAWECQLKLLVYLVVSSKAMAIHPRSVALCT